MSKASAVLERDRPHRRAHEASVRAKAAVPRDLLAWFLEGFRAELPERVHQQDVWRDRRTAGDPDAYHPVGGSLLGSPRIAEPFRQFIEDSPFAVEVAEYEGQADRTPHFRTPMRAAMARVAGRGPDDARYPFMARALYRTALRDGDWDGACASLGIIEPVRWPYIQAALRHLWDRYSEIPPVVAFRPSAEDAVA
jgi:hypothetical protein